MASLPNHEAGFVSDDPDELGVAENPLIKKYIYFTMALLLLAAIVLIFLRYVLYLW